MSRWGELIPHSEDDPACLCGCQDEDGTVAVRWFGERGTVLCDEGCGAFAEPLTLDEYRAALEHWKNHHESGGCSHGR